MSLVKYIGTKVVSAEPMTRKEYNDFRGWIVPENENPDDAGYLVIYENSKPQPELADKVSGYVSWSPKDVFELSYKPTDSITLKTTFNFGTALSILKQGYKVSRSGWNGKGMYLFLVKGKVVKEAIHSCYGDPNIKIDSAMDVCDAIYMKTADNKLIPWLASQSDVLSEDWSVVH